MLGSETETDRRERAGDGSGEPDEAVDEQVVYRSSPTEWFLLTGHRAVVAGLLLAGIFLVLFGLVRGGVIAVRNDGPLSRTFTAIVGGNLTLLTIVVSINQLILAREFGTPDELYEQIQEIIEYRREVEETTDAEVSPVTPDEFLSFLMRVTRQRARDLRETTAGPGTGEPDAELARLADIIEEQSGRVSRELEGSSSGAFSTLVTILDVNFTRDLHRARQLRNRYGEELTEDRREGLGDLVRLLEFSGVMRQYLETLYMQRELTGLSRKLLYTGVPAIVIGIAAAWLYGLSTGPTLSEPTLSVVVPAAAAIGLVPLTVFSAYIVRIATIARRTASLMPFNVHESNME